MELELVLTPEDGADTAFDSGLASPMGGKNQRRLSLSAKWATNKALALEYLKRQREALLWIESVLDRKLETRDLFEALKSGIVLRELLAKLYPAPSQCLSPISRNYSSRMAPWKERENITVFLKQCKSLGMNDLFLFCTDDLYEGTNMVQVLFGVQHFMAFSQERSSYMFKPVANETVAFSNQELELALSKIEKAGVDVNVLLTSAPPSATPSPSKSHVETDDPIGDYAPSTASSDISDDAIEAQEEREPAEELLDGEEGADALAALEMELLDHEDNNVERHEEDLGPLVDEPHDEEPHVELISEDEFAACDGEHAHLEAESKLPALETDDDDLATLASLKDMAEAEIFAFIAAEMDESITLLEILEDMIQQIELHTVFSKTSLADAVIAEGLLEAEPTDGTSVVRMDSVGLSENTDKHDTFVGDSLAPTVVDTPAAEDTEAPANRFSRAARASKKGSKAASKAGRKKRESSNEPLDEVAMSKCTCGSKCSIM